MVGLIFRLQVVKMVVAGGISTINLITEQIVMAHDGILLYFHAVVKTILC